METALDLLQYLAQERVSINLDREATIGVVLLRAMLEQGYVVEGALERLEQLEVLEPREQLLQGLLYEVYQREQLERDSKQVLRHMKNSVSGEASWVVVMVMYMWGVLIWCWVV